MTPFEIWWREHGAIDRNGKAKAMCLRTWLACAAEAERLCREKAHAQSCFHETCTAHRADADAIAKLREVDRG